MKRRRDAAPREKQLDFYAAICKNGDDGRLDFLKSRMCRFLDFTTSGTAPAENAVLERKNRFD
ncbi:hypothetical protein [Caproicibacter fermentans]|uniref:Uncharacterized protein n=1 Tax=Caproicibacter fermentans TaxID=2576756 RepID=A0A7G8T746_9FIRM|nr:hypothetical protein [Caproicibacter fermentans]OCN01648.1 hypothetical protein A7X67_00705 [Clostridium sp. W14A]QNK39437.1 hypothetical protein HCR03_11825 [Caproicibacter fermentans]